MGKRKGGSGEEPQAPSKRERVARAELKRVEDFLRSAKRTESTRPLTEHERALVDKARQLRRRLYARLGPKPLPGNKKTARVGRPMPKGGIRSVVSGGLPGLGRHG